MNYIKCFFSRPEISKSLSIYLLVLRVLVGVAFILHGWGKIQNPFNWMSAESGVPGVLQFLAAFSEFGGGLSLIIGLVVPLSMLGLGFTMAVAVVMHAFIWGDPFVASQGGSYELPLIYLALCVLFGGVGPGRYSLDSKIFSKAS